MQTDSASGGILNQTGGLVWAAFDQARWGSGGTYNLSGGNAVLANFVMAGTFNLSGTGNVGTARGFPQISGTFNQTEGTFSGPQYLVELTT